MTFPSRGCRTCRQRRIKCDGARPVCEKCQKAKRTCQFLEESGNLIFLNENDYAIGRRKRPRGPNLKPVPVTQAESQEGILDGQHRNSTTSNDAALIVAPREELQVTTIPLALDTPLEDHALTYYMRFHIDVPQGLPEIVDDHMQFVFSSWCCNQSQSVLDLAIHAVSHATFGRARKSNAALAVGRSKYSKALMKTNSALRNPFEATDDEVLLAVMLLSFYENSVLNRSSKVSGYSIQDIASPSFTHHDGAMAILQLRRQASNRTTYSLNLDKLVRRQLVRSLLLRSRSVPPWLEDGALYGEHGLALELDRCMVAVASLRQRAETLFMSYSNMLEPFGSDPLQNFRDILVEAQEADDILAMWAKSIPAEESCTVHSFKGHLHNGTSNRILNTTVHLYPTVGHAAMWNRYRALRLVVHDVMDKTLYVLMSTSNIDTKSESLSVVTRFFMQRLADDLCASIPYMLGLLEIGAGPGEDVTVTAKAQLSSPKETVKAITASFLCWPLVMVASVSALPEKHLQYLRDCLLDVSEIVDDGVLEKVAMGGSSVSHGLVSKS